MVNLEKFILPFNFFNFNGEKNSIKIEKIDGKTELF